MAPCFPIRQTSPTVFLPSLTCHGRSPTFCALGSLRRCSQGCLTGSKHKFSSPATQGSLQTVHSLLAMVAKVIGTRRGCHCHHTYLWHLHCASTDTFWLWLPTPLRSEKKVFQTSVAPSLPRNRMRVPKNELGCRTGLGMGIIPAICTPLTNEMLLLSLIPP